MAPARRIQDAMEKIGPESDHVRYLEQEARLESNGGGKRTASHCDSCGQVGTRALMEIAWDSISIDWTLLLERLVFRNKCLLGEWPTCSKQCLK